MSGGAFTRVRGALARYDARLSSGNLPPAIRWLFSWQTYVGLIVMYFVWIVLPWGLIYRIPGMAAFCKLISQIFPLIPGAARNAELVPYEHALMELSVLFCLGAIAAITVPFGCRPRGVFTVRKWRWKMFVCCISLSLAGGLAFALLMYGDAGKPEAKAWYSGEWKMVAVFIWCWWATTVCFVFGAQALIWGLFINRLKIVTKGDQK